MSVQNINICTSERVPGCAYEDGGRAGGVVCDRGGDDLRIKSVVCEDCDAVFSIQASLGGSGMHHGVSSVTIFDSENVPSPEGSPARACHLAHAPVRRSSFDR